MSLPPLIKEDEGTDKEWKRRVRDLLNLTVRRTSGSGPTAERPKRPNIGYTFFDTTLGCPIWWNGSIWVKVAVTAA